MRTAIQLSCLFVGALWLRVVPVAALELPSPKQVFDQILASRTAAEQALPVVDAMAKSAARDQLGFAPGDDLSRAELGRPLPVFNLDLDAVQQLDSKLGLGKLLSSVNQVIYPIRVGGKLRSSVKVSLKGDSWQLISIGSSHLTQTLVEMEAKLGKQPAYAINLSSIYQMLLVYFGLGEPKFVPIYDTRYSRLVAEQEYGAEAIDHLLEHANSHKPPLLESD